MNCRAPTVVTARSLSSSAVMSLFQRDVEEVVTFTRAKSHRTSYQEIGAPAEPLEIGLRWPSFA